MFARKFITLNLIVHVIVVLNSADIVDAARCTRVPEGSGAKRSPSTGNFRVRLSDDSGVYKPGRQYTVFLERNSNTIRSRDRPRPTFTGFFLAVEQKTNITTMFSEDFTPVKHGTFKVSEDDTLTKLICGNVVTHTSDTAKSDIQVNWTAPEPGAGCVTFRATIIEHRDVWYMDDGPLSRDFCEDEDNQEDFISNVLEECCACYEAKYELTFEGLWSRNTHPKGFPRNVYTTKFGDIIGATHKIGNGFWANGDLASEGLKEVAELGITRTLEAELKSKSDSIRTIIKARGLSYPNITGKTFAVFRVDSENHLVSFVSTLSPSPDWFVGVSALELCQSDCTWLESKVVDLYPWDAGTDKGATYDSPDQPSKPPEYIRRITSESPNNNESPFFNPSGSKMKPLARLTLLRQRLYEKNCSAEQSASDDCHVGEYGPWGECTGAVCGETGKQYRQRYYRYPEKATKCRRKLFETKSCTMPKCTHENEENVPTDPMCESKAYYSEWSPCSPKCKNSENERGKRTRTLKFKKGFYKECAGRDKRPQVIEEPCDIEWCVGRNQIVGNESPDQTETESPNGNENENRDQVEEQTRQPAVDCSNVPYKKWEYTRCNVTCGNGKMNRTRESYNPECEAITEVIDCHLPPCKNKEFCTTLLDTQNCRRTELSSNYIFYDAASCACGVFTTNCLKDEGTNMFETFEECWTACPEELENCSGGEVTERPVDTGTYRRGRVRPRY